MRGTGWDAAEKGGGACTKKLKEGPGSADEGAQAETRVQYAGNGTDTVLTGERRPAAVDGKWEPWRGR